MVGYLAVSLAGHDRNRIYMIMEETETSVLLSDGNIRPVSKMKWKKKKHIQLIKQIVDADLTERIRNKQTFRDEEIKYALRNYQKKLTQGKEQ